MDITHRLKLYNLLKKLFNFTEGEGRHLAFFLLLFVFLGLGMAVGKSSSNTLFLKRYGVEYLPAMYIALSFTLALISIMYAAFVDRLPPERFFKIIFLVQTVILIFFWFLISQTQLDDIFPAYFLLYGVISEIIIVHAAFYLDQNFDTIQSKRLTSLIFAGYQLGMIFGSLIFAATVSSIGLEYSPIIWSIFLIASITMITLWHKRHGVSPFFYPPSKSGQGQIRSAAKQVTQGLGFIKQSPLLKDASLALFFMVISYYVLSFGIYTIYTNEFSNEADLAAFLGILVASTNTLALTLQVLVTSRAIERFGVRKIKLIYPFTLLASFITLLISPGFIAGIIASINKDAIMPAFRNPSRQMFFNVLPNYMKGRARATSVVIVLPLALLVCGSLLMSIRHSSLIPVYILGLMSTSLYLFYCYRMGKNYVNTLIGNMKERLFIPKGSVLEDYQGDSEEIYQNLLDGLKSENGQVSLSYARIMEDRYRERAVEDILDRISHADIRTADQMSQLIYKHINLNNAERLLKLAEEKDDHFKATILKAVFENCGPRYSHLISEALNDDNDRIRSKAIEAIIKFKIHSLIDQASGSWLELINGSKQQRMVSLDLICLLDHHKSDQHIDAYKHCVEELMKDAEDHVKERLYRALTIWHHGDLPEIESTIAKDLDNHNHVVRKSAVSCLNLLKNKTDVEKNILRALDDGHQSVRIAGVLLINSYFEEPVEEIHRLLKDNAGTPRAQKELVKELMDKGVDHPLLGDITKSKIEYALRLIDAISVLSNNRSTYSAVNLIEVTLKERLNQVIDLILFTLTPLAQSDILAVIRAGINSKDKRHIANAREALLEIDEIEDIEPLVALLDKQQDLVDNPEELFSMASVREIITWCTNLNDQWMQHMGLSALDQIGTEQPA